MDAKAQRLHNILEGEKQYTIPVFQRYYSWNQKHWTDLWNDILSLLEEGISKEHFIGAFVCMAGRHTPDAVPDYILIDGQQRLATITILLCVLRDLAKEKGFQDQANEIQEKYIIDKFKTGLESYKIISRSKDRQFLMGLIDGNPPDGESKIIEASQYFRKEIASLIGTHSELVIKKLFTIITKQLSLVMITLSDDENPFAIFETLNERGLRLEESDLIRNHIFMQLPLNEQDQFDREAWTPFEAIFEKTEQFEAIKLTDFYRDYLMRNGEYVKKNETYLKFKANNISPQDLVRNLKRYGKFYTVIHRPKTADDPMIVEILERIGHLDITTSYPLLLHLFDKYDGGVLSQDDFLASLHALESFVIRRSICGESTRGYNYLFPAALRALKSDIRSSLVTFFHEKGWPNDERFKEALRRFELYAREPNKCRMILEALEKSVEHKERVDFANLTIEHIMPQTLTEEWKQELGEKWEHIFETWVHTIGNLTLTGYNPEMSRKLFSEKKIQLAESNLQLNKYFAEIEVWDKSAIIARGEKLAEEIAKIWERQ